MEASDFVTIVVSACGVLGGAIAFLFHLFVKQTAEQRALAERVGRLEGEAKGIEELSAKTLETVHKAIAERDKK